MKKEERKGKKSRKHKESEKKERKKKAGEKRERSDEEKKHGEKSRPKRQASVVAFKRIQKQHKSEERKGEFESEAPFPLAQIEEGQPRPTTPTPPLGEVWMRISSEPVVPEKCTSCDALRDPSSSSSDPPGAKYFMCERGCPNPQRRPW